MIVIKQFVFAVASGDCLGRSKTRDLGRWWPISNVIAWNRIFRITIIYLLWSHWKVFLWYERSIHNIHIIYHIGLYYILFAFGNADNFIIYNVLPMHMCIIVVVANRSCEYTIIICFEFKFIGRVLLVCRR